ncbi:MAG: hypothetical protein CMD70_07520, partial [Gammaproteobacteria bacterium]|nr:hypothetical protein [Gammaproteobacteria bacterium]
LQPEKDGKELYLKSEHKVGLLNRKQLLAREVFLLQIQLPADALLEQNLTRPLHAHDRCVQLDLIVRLTL